MTDFRRLGICDRTCELLKTFNDIIKGFKALNINISEKVIEKAKELIIQVAEHEILIACKSNTIVSACIYLASHLCNEPLTQLQIVDANRKAGYSLAEPSIKRACRTITDHLENI